ncbi:putative Heterokaryon incompatibility domain-containing protein [Seiridium unicorne]|uniref:Heterokaryon incompatibility domain-containing protein n=1 Tax=Seiridium unicorne TaxID=138068 RepID=A0ABR2VGQ4_9PEZI
MSRVHRRGSPDAPALHRGIKMLPYIILRRSGRSAQVFLMGFTYTQAKTCAAWLGGADEHMKNALKIGHEHWYDGPPLRTDFSENGLSTGRGEVTKWLSNLSTPNAISSGVTISRTWFSRIWVPQDVTLAVTLTSLCGETAFGFDVVLSVLSEISNTNMIALSRKPQVDIVIEQALGLKRGSYQRCLRYACYESGTLAQVGEPQFYADYTLSPEETYVSKNLGDHRHSVHTLVLLDLNSRNGKSMSHPSIRIVLEIVHRGQVQRRTAKSTLGTIILGSGDNHSNDEVADSIGSKRILKPTSQEGLSTQLDNIYELCGRNSLEVLQEKCSSIPNRAGMAGLGSELKTFFDKLWSKVSSADNLENITSLFYSDFKGQPLLLHGDILGFATEQYGRLDMGYPVQEGGQILILHGSKIPVVPKQLDNGSYEYCGKIYTQWANGDDVAGERDI